MGCIAHLWLVILRCQNRRGKSLLSWLTQFWCLQLYREMGKYGREWRLCRVRLVEGLVGTGQSCIQAFRARRDNSEGQLYTCEDIHWYVMAQWNQTNGWCEWLQAPRREEQLVEQLPLLTELEVVTKGTWTPVFILPFLPACSCVFASSSLWP